MKSRLAKLLVLTLAVFATIQGSERLVLAEYFTGVG